eukprot:2199421-Prymnesium_polylepis.1
MPALPERVQCVRLLRAARVARQTPASWLRRRVEEPPAHLRDRPDVRRPLAAAVFARRLRDELQHARPVLRRAIEEQGLVEMQPLGQLPGHLHR